MASNESPGSSNPRTPAHIAIIMDGNGRWAQERGLPRTKGHEAGVEALREVTEACMELGVRQLTLYAFSTENWSRPKRELNFLWRLLTKFLAKERSRLREHDIRFVAIGRIDGLPEAVRDEVRRTEEFSRGHKRMTLCLALNYGSKAELEDAVRSISADVLAGRLAPGAITADAIEGRLYTAGMLPLDLLIRTAGEQRLSNFLLWQASYAELWFAQVYWPDFKKEHLKRAVQAFTRRERRFGSLKAV